jgi:hypothetical protein
MLRTRDQFLALLGYDVDAMTDKAKSRTAQRIVDEAGTEYGLTMRQLKIPGTRAFRYYQADIDRLFKLSELTPAL